MMAGRPGRRARLRAEAVAHATVAGAELAAPIAGADVATIREWMDEAGVEPAAAVDPDDWRQLMADALAQVRADIATGRVGTVALATIAGIARRNARPREPEQDRTPAEQWCDRLEGHVPPGRMTVAYLAVLDWLETVPDDAPPPDDAAVIAYLGSVNLDTHREQRRRLSEQRAAEVAARSQLVASFVKSGVPTAEAIALADDRNVTDLLAKAELYLATEIADD